MKNARRATVLTLLVAAFAALAGPAGASALKAQKTYYVSLGDSLAVGVQPNPAGKSVPTKFGYANDLATIIASRGMTLKKLGCPGETSKTFIAGGICSYRGGSQLRAAVNFIRHHKVGLVTIDIGANDVDPCGTATDIIGCSTAGAAVTQHNLPIIVKQLRAAGGPKLEMVGMTYYDPFLAFALSSDATKRPLAQLSVGLAQAINTGLTKIYKSQKFKVADVATAFNTYVPFTTTTKLPAPFGTVPSAVASICAYTWMCAPAPMGPNIHANAVGYTLIAQTFSKVL